MLFAAGLGTRLKPFTDHHPKALARVEGRTLLELAIRYLQRHGIREVVVNVHHFADQIIRELADNDGFGSRVQVSDESGEVLETGGGLLKAVSLFEGEESWVALNVDILTNLDLTALIAAHQRSNALATLAVMQRDSSRQLLFDDSMALCGWRNNQTGQERAARDIAATQPRAFSGIQVVSRALVAGITRSGKFSLIDVYLDAARTATIQGYDHTGDAMIDVGKPESLALAGALLREV